MPDLVCSALILQTKSIMNKQQRKIKVLIIIIIIIIITNIKDWIL